MISIALAESRNMGQISVNDMSAFRLASVRLCKL